MLFEAVRALAESSNAYMSICRHQYIGANAGIHLSLDSLGKLNSLALELDVDTYISGVEIESVIAHNTSR